MTKSNEKPPLMDLIPNVHILTSNDWWMANSSETLLTVDVTHYDLKGHHLGHHPSGARCETLIIATFLSFTAVLKTAASDTKWNDRQQLGYLCYVADVAYGHLEK